MSKSYVSMILSVAAALVACAASASIEFSSSGAKLCLSERCGAVESLVTADGAERVVPAAEAFTLQLLDGKGEPTRLKSSEFAFEGFSRVDRVEKVNRVTCSGGNVNEDKSSRNFSTFQPFNFSTCTWRHANGLVVRMKIEAADGEFRFTPSVEGIPVGMLLEWFDGPQVCIAPDRKLFWPEWDGVEVTKFSHPFHPAGFHPIGFRERYAPPGGNSLYPGLAQMQFMAAYKDDMGIYFSAVDGRHTPKAVDWEDLGANGVRLTLQTFCGDLDADGAWRAKFHYSLRPYDGGWMEACEMYRDWVRTLPDFAKTPKRPKWMYDSPVNLIYPVRGYGRDNGRDMKPNRMFPYMNAMPYVEKFGRLLDSKIMALLMHWEGTAPWAPPYVWPPFGGEEELAKFRDALHARGDLLGVYCSGTAWTQISSIVPTYSLEQRFEDEHLGRHMMRGPKGQITSCICNGHDGQRLGYDMCLAEDWCVGEIVAEAAKLSRFGIDYSQFFDQNMGGGWLLCYAKHHKHPPIPGAWAVDAMLALQRRLAAAEGDGGMVFGCEAAAATPYVPTLSYNDVRPIPGLMRFGRPVPGSAFVFHEWMCNFTGNQCGMTKRMDAFWRWMSGFHNGDMFSLVLNDSGEVVCGWPSPWSNGPLPERDGLVSVIRELNAIRKKHPSFLLEGKMVRPFVRCESRPAVVDYEGWQSGKVETTEVLTSFWENSKGERVGFASNWRREPSDLKITRPDGRVETRTLAPLETIELEVETVPFPERAFFHEGKGGFVLDVTKPPFNAKGDGIHDDTAALSAAMRYIQEHLQPQRTKNGDVRCFQKRDASWIVYLPNGTYRVTDTVWQGWPALAMNITNGWYHVAYFHVESPEHEARITDEKDPKSGRAVLYVECNWQIRVCGESREKTIIRLDDNAPGFKDPKAVVSFHVLRKGSNIDLGNILENVTIDVGRGNPGAAALAYSCSNYGGVRNVSLKSSDGKARVGIDMGVRNACSEMHGLDIDGFETGVRVASGAETVVVLEDSRIVRAKTGVLAADAKHGCNMVALRRVRMDGVDERVREGRNSSVVEIDASATCDFPATDTRYSPAETACVEDFGAVGDGIHDDTAAIERAFASGRPAIVFTRAVYRIDGVVEIPRTVRCLDGLYAWFVRTVARPEAAFALREADSALLVFRRAGFAGGTLFDHFASRPVAFEDVYTEFPHMHGYYEEDGAAVPKGVDPKSGVWETYRNADTSTRKKVYARACISFTADEPLENVDFVGRLVNNEHLNDAAFWFKSGTAEVVGAKSEDSKVFLRASDGAKVKFICGNCYQFLKHNDSWGAESIDSELEFLLGAWSIYKYEGRFLRVVDGGREEIVPLEKCRRGGKDGVAFIVNNCK